MEKHKYDELLAVYKVINTFWKTFKEDASNVGADDVWVMDMLTRYDRICNEYSEGPLKDFTLDLSKAFVRELERLFKEKNGY